MNTKSTLIGYTSIAGLFSLLFFVPSVTFGAEFLPLTSIPGVQEAVASGSLSILLNSLYRICIGAAAVIAVLKIIQGGVTYMLGDSVTEKREAKHHIAMAILGLVLVLSPYLVFSIIDPRILDLDVDVSGLVPPAPTGIDPNGVSGQFAPGATQSSGTWESTDPAAQAACERQGGTFTADSNGTLRCAQISTKTDKFPQGRTPITLSEENACINQRPERCTVEYLVRGQKNCWCSGFFETSTQFRTFVSTNRDPDHPACTYIQVASYPDQETCQAALPTLRASTRTSEGITQSKSIREECVPPDRQVIKFAGDCVPVGQIGG